MLITCPNCQTRYRVASDALSAAGRQVQCANCAGLWYATPGFPAPSAPAADPDPSDDEMVFRADRDVLFSPADEALLDAAFLDTEPQSAFPAPDPADTPPNFRPIHDLTMKRASEEMNPVFLMALPAYHLPTRSDGSGAAALAPHGPLRAQAVDRSATNHASPNNIRSPKRKSVGRHEADPPVSPGIPTVT